MQLETANIASQVDAFASRFSDDNVDLKTKFSVAGELRDAIDLYQTSNDYEHFLQKLLSVFINLLASTPVSFNAASMEQRFRNCILDIILRMHMNDTFKPYATQVLTVIMGMLKVENEDNGVLCMKIITSLHKAYKVLLIDQIQPFLDIVIELYQNIPQVVKENFSINSSASGTTPVNTFQSPRPMSPTMGSAEFSSEPTTKPLQKTMHSFKVLTECPIIVVLLYSTHKQIAQQSLTVFIPHIVEMLNLQAPPQVEAHAAAKAKGEIHTSVSPQIKNRVLYGEFITSQVKTMSFLAYALRGYAPLLKTYYSLIPEFVVRLLQDCPPELSPARKELLVATRHILSTEFRKLFIPKVDIMLNEKVLIGDGLTVHETLRPLAYSTMADLVHHVRAELTPAQIWKTVTVYCKNMQDSLLATSFQIMSAKLLLNLVERIMKLPDRTEGRQIMILILNAFTERFGALNRSYDNIMKNHVKFVAKEKMALNKENPDAKEQESDVMHNKIEEIKEEENESQTAKSEGTSPKSVMDNNMIDEISSEDEKKIGHLNDLDFFDIQRDGLIDIHFKNSSDPLKDARYLFKNLMNFLKTVIFGLKSCNPSPPNNEFNLQQWQESARIFNYEQIHIFRKLFREGIAGHLFFASSSEVETDVTKPGVDLASNNVPIVSSKDEKDLMETFATVFIHIDPASFNEIVEAELPFLYESMFKNSALLHIPQFFLASEATSANFSSLLIAFLKEKLPELGEGDVQKANILNRLFKLCFMAVNLFPNANEIVILPHLKDLIIESLHLTTKAEDPLIYFYLLRTLFRSIGGGRFEMLYKEVLPLLQVLLESLNRLLATARKPQERDIYVELCLTVPVRLSVLVPHLNYLMRPLVVALNGSPELVSQGLRTLELCVDNLTAEYFDPILETVMEEVMEALWKHLRPLPYYHQYSHTTLRILGKLGGRNRRFIKPPSNLEIPTKYDLDINVMLPINGIHEKKPVNLTGAISVAFKIMEDVRIKPIHRQNAYSYLSNILKLFLNSEDIPKDFDVTIKKAVQIIVTNEFPEIDEPLPNGKLNNISKFKLQNELLTSLLGAVFYGVSIPEMKDSAHALIKNLCEHIVVLELGQYVLNQRKNHISFDLNEHEGTAYLDTKSLITAIIRALSHYIKDIREVGQQAIHYIYEASLTMFGSIENVQKFPLFRSMFGTFSHYCFEEEYFMKYGACLGLDTLIRGIGLKFSWIADRRVEFSRTMFFVLKDIPTDVPSQVCDAATDLLYYVLEEFNSNITPEQTEDRSFKQLTGLLAYELGNANINVRKASQGSLKIISKVSNKSITEILIPVKTILLTPIFGKPLRALPFPMQIGHIDAVTFCLGLDDHFLEFNEELTRLIHEALALVDAEDESLTSSHRVFEHRTSEQLVQLRIVCIRLLALALQNTDYHSIQQTQTRSRIIAVFFKTLYSKSKDVIEAAHTGLKSVLAPNNKLPKDLLQNGLRPILMNLSDPKKLNVAGLEGLARLLELLTNYFKVEIGKKLLDHLVVWSEPAQLHHLSVRNLSTQNVIKVIAAIFNIFHLLPPTAHFFMPELITKLFYLENHLRRQHSSPFREPIAKFLVKYPSESIQYFLPKLSKRSYGRFFASILSFECAGPLRNYTKENFDQLTSRLKLDESDEEKCTCVCNSIYIMRALSMDDSSWVSTQREFLDYIISFSKNLVQTSHASALVSPIRIQVEQALEELQNIIVLNLKEKKDLDLTFDIIKATTTYNFKISDVLQDFIFSNIVASTDDLLRREYLVKAIEIATNKTNTLTCRTFIFKFVINPILIVEGDRNGNFYTLLEKTHFRGGNTWLDIVHTKIWRPAYLDVGDDGLGTVDHYRFELLQTSALLIKYASNYVLDVRKDIIKFAWNYIKLDDIVSKQSAYVLVAFFIAEFDTLPKIVVQIYVALLKAHQSDARRLVKQALDLLAPVIPKRLNPPVWARWARRILSEDGHNVSQVLNVYQFIVRHPELFFEHRGLLISNIITAMPKLSFVANSPSENQILAVDLSELVLKWENMAYEGRLREETSRKRKASEIEENENTSDQNSVLPLSSSTFSSSLNYSVPFIHRETCVTYLIRFVCMSPHKAVDSPLGQRILKTLHELLGPNHWSEVSVKLNFFERSLIHNELALPQQLGVCLNTLEVVCVTLDRKPASWIIDNLPQLERLLEKSIRSSNSDIQESLQKVLKIILDAVDLEEDKEEDTPEEISSFMNLLSTVIQENLNTAVSIPAGVSLACAMANSNPSSIDNLLPAIMKALQKLCKDHISQNQSSASPDTAGNSSVNQNGANRAGANGNEQTQSLTEMESKLTVKMLEKILDLISMRISYLGDQRRVFLSLFAQLIERSVDKGLCTRLIEITKGWVFSKTDLFPTTKEKAAILFKMMVFEMRHDMELTHMFYKIVVAIYEDPAFARTELAVRMEQPFLIGTRLDEVPVRQKLMKIFNDNVELNVVKRLFYIISDQNWEYLSDYQWINQALQLLYGSIKKTPGITLSNDDYRIAPLSFINEGLPSTAKVGEDIFTPDLDAFLIRRSEFVKSLSLLTADDILKPLIEIQFINSDVVHKLWLVMFPIAFSAVPKKERNNVSLALISLLSKDYHNSQVLKRPNVIQSMVDAISMCDNLMMPPHLIKYLGKTFDGWFPAMKILEEMNVPPSENAKVHESGLDALTEIYADIQEDDMFYGIWRRRAKYSETNSALSYEQCGMWTRALQLYEAAQIRARSGVLPYSESEYGLWEDHWILCAQKLQQWDILTELAKHEGFTDLLLECGWRVADWNTDKEPLEQSIKTVMDVPTPRRQIFETFLCLQSYAQKSQTLQDLSKHCDEGIQLALRKWFSLPKPVVGAHFSLLYTFQQYVEFMEASQVYMSLASTNVQNLDVKSQELKGVLGAWRERLPNVWDDINIWGDLVTWRQHAFGVINKVYLPLIPALQQTNGNNNSNSFAYRGYHEIAWIINRFAHVARKHNMADVCISQLTKIYTLPNIEIQEAFLKLREQAKCHYQNVSELNTGLDVISNTNLVYFGAQQKAEFFTLKGMFLAKLNVMDDANQAFATAVQIDLYLPKAWAEWGYFNDRRFKENPKDIIYASNAISCYLQAAGLYKNGKTRKLLARILWLISLDDSTGSLAQAFDSYRGEVPVWYWITFIPQLLTSLSHKEARMARHILIKIAKSYPQALHFHLRTTKEDYAVIQRQAAHAAAANKSAQQSAQAATGTQATSTGQTVQASSATGIPSNTSPANRQPWEHVDEIMGILKTAYPLLAFSLETLVDQIYQRFKCPVDEDAYRLIVALLNDGVQYMGRLQYPKEDAKLPPATEANITRFTESVLPQYIRAQFEKDFVTDKPNLEDYVNKLRVWRDRFEEKLDRRPLSINLEALSPHLSEFHYQKFEDVEIPGQYLQQKDNNLHFIKVDRFMPTVDVVRGFGICSRRITIRGHDGSMHAFAVQYPAARYCRREERVVQLFRILNTFLGRNKETRRRNLQFTLPAAVPLSPHIRLVEDDSRYISMLAIYEDFCNRIGQSRDEPINYITKKMRAAFDPKFPKPDISSVKMEILCAIQANLVPSTVLRDYFARTYRSFEDFWLFRKQFSHQYAGVVFMTFMMSINNRTPHKLLINQGSGDVWATEMLPTIPPQKSSPAFHNGEPVAFRLTPNIQALMGPTALEGLFSMSVMNIARCLTEPELDLEQYLSLFVRDEMISWYTQQHRPSVQDQQLREIVRVNVETIVKRAISLAQVGQGNIPANQTVIDLISQAVNPRNLALTDHLWMAYL
ncbi:hypothetical protein NADFUDRAFT_28952 [Nadsonia fulvescens var. elongata DSM 6958]|uniref:Non-specific serine/threonine protein kinase n=1 Tax=Nadsonia fulvescens var. elongata DSM 6958 TaxID=857566 RepID=A0A1E3PEL8_9ASCO|nr:hypothetical protein NADFUDRAFT_28952 [Nadsonia fulvescens var. elongata DSM 6958]